MILQETKDAFKSTSLVLMGDFSLPEISWENHAVQSRPGDALKNPVDNFMAQFLKEQNWKDTLLDLLLVNREDFVSKVGVGSCSGHCNHEAIKFKISFDGRKSASKTPTLAMRRDFSTLQAAQGIIE